MKILHITDDFSLVRGGVPAAINLLSTNLLKASHEVNILHTSNLNYKMPDGAIDISCPPSGVLRFWNHSNLLRATIKDFIKKNSGSEFIIHIHGLWNAPQFFAAFYAIKYKTPFIVTFHGMVEDWLWKKQGIIKRIKKNIYWYLVIKRCFLKASAIHAITINEELTIQKLTNEETPIYIIPNTVSVRILTRTNTKPQSLKKNILFLGRIDRVKGVDILVRAFINADISEKWRLIIAGPIADKSYKNEIDIMIKNANNKTIKFIGPVFDDEKRELLSSSWVAAAPSYTEVIGLVNLEAAIHELPSITTYNTGLHDWEEGGGLLSHPSINSFTYAIEKVTQWSTDTRLKKGVLSKALVDKKYSNEHVLDKWSKLYKEAYKRNKNAQ